MEFQPYGRHFLGTGDEHLLTVQREKVRTLPHLSVLVVACVQRADKLPFEVFNAPVKENCTAAVGGPVANDGVEIPVLVPPDLGVPEIDGAAALGQILSI